MSDDADVVELWMAAGADLAAYLGEHDMRELPPVPSEQPNFYPTSDHGHAERIARHYHVPLSGVGYVLRMEVLREVIEMYDEHRKKKGAPVEYWIPAGDLQLFNRSIVGRIEIVSEHRRKPPPDNHASVRDLQAMGRPKQRAVAPG